MYVIIFSVFVNKWEFSKFSTNIFNRRCMPHYFEFQTSKRKWIHRKRKCGKIKLFFSPNHFIRNNVSLLHFSLYSFGKLTPAWPQQHVEFQSNPKLICTKYTYFQICLFKVFPKDQNRNKFLNVIIFSVSFNKWEFSKFSTNIFNRRCMSHYFEFQTSKRKWIHRKRKCGKIRCFRRFALWKSQPRSLSLLFEGPWCLSSVVCHGFIRLIPGT